MNNLRQKLARLVQPENLMLCLQTCCMFLKTSNISLDVWQKLASTFTVRGHDYVSKTVIPVTDSCDTFDTLRLQLAQLAYAWLCGRVRRWAGDHQGTTRSVLNKPCPCNRFAWSCNLISELCPRTYGGIRLQSAHAHFCLVDSSVVVKVASTIWQ